MGMTISNSLKSNILRLFSFTGGNSNKKQIRLLMLGLDSAGKTTILYKLKIGEAEIKRTTPTIGFNVESVVHKNVSFLIWDVGGQSKLRCLWRHYYDNTQGLIFVIDSTDRERINDSKVIFYNILLEDALRDAVILILVNKQDVLDAMSVHEVQDFMELHRLQRSKRKYCVVGCAGLTGAGLFEAFEWLSEEIAKKQKTNNIFTQFMN